MTYFFGLCCVFLLKLQAYCYTFPLSTSVLGKLLVKTVLFDRRLDSRTVVHLNYTWMKWKIVSISGYSYFCDVIVLVDRETGSPGVLRARSPMARSPMVCESYDLEFLPGVAEGKEKWGSNTAMTAYNGVCTASLKQCSAVLSDRQSYCLSVHHRQASACTKRYSTSRH